MRLRTIYFFCFICIIVTGSKAQLVLSPTNTADIPFVQEYHIPHFPKGLKDANIRSIATDDQSNIWIATSEGIFKKHINGTGWEKVISGLEDGPAYTVLYDPASGIWAGTWKGVFHYRYNAFKKMADTNGPVSVLCVAKDGVYAFGPRDIWLCTPAASTRKDIRIAKSVRSAISDGNTGVWIGTDVGLYHYTPGSLKYFFDTSYLISAYIKGVAIKGNDVWAGGLGGVTILNGYNKKKTLRTADGLSSQYVNCVAVAPDSSVWVGTDVGIVRFHNNGSKSLRFSRRWLLNDKVNQITFDKEGTAWIATQEGVSAIHSKLMTLAEKEKYFYDVTMQRHVREPWIVGQCRLPDPNDVTRWEPEDDDNDGEYGGNYLAMESFRYAVTKNNDAKEKAKKMFDFLKLLEEITETDGFFARTIVPASWGDNVHDKNLKYTDKALAEELVKEPRFKPVEMRWRKSKDGKWLWKGDTSSDEWCGHMMGYFFYYELVADKKEKQVVAKHVAKLVDHLIRNNFNMIDIDGQHTRWSVWSPDNLNRDPEWMPDRNQNAMEMLSFLKLAHYMTGNNKYQQHYLRLIKDEHYLENMKKIQQQNPAWFIYFDVVLQMYLYPILLHCEKDPELLQFYQSHFDTWMLARKDDKNPLINFFYSYATHKKNELPASVEFLKDTPLDLVNWGIDHSKREDVQMVRVPVLDDLQVSELPPASIRATVRWDKNPWTAVNGQTNTEREPVFWLLPYWMGRYLKMIE
ncbi:MAG: regulator [Sphingobacteriales bacterium 40-81]|nr:MAG: regulator [Sphingobacteriales bacterium 40-81]